MPKANAPCCPSTPVHSATNPTFKPSLVTSLKPNPFPLRTLYSSTLKPTPNRTTLFLSTPHLRPSSEPLNLTTHSTLFDSSLTYQIYLRIHPKTRNPKLSIKKKESFPLTAESLPCTAVCLNVGLFCKIRASTTTSPLLDKFYC